MNKLALIAALLLAACDADHSPAVKALDVHGFSGVKVTDSSYLPELYGCSKTDDIAYIAVATNPAGKRVEVLVCCGYVWKGCTVRSR